MCVGIKRILGCGLLLLISILMMGANAETAPGRLGWAVGVCPNSMRRVARSRFLCRVDYQNCLDALSRLH
jgi:hypothetical protein